MPYLIDNRATESEPAWSPGRSTKSSKSPMAHEPSPLPLPPVFASAVAVSDATLSDGVTQNVAYSESDISCMPTTQRPVKVAADVTTGIPVSAFSMTAPCTTHPLYTAPRMGILTQNACLDDAHCTSTAHPSTSLEPIAAAATSASHVTEACAEHRNAPHYRGGHVPSDELRSSMIAKADAHDARIEQSWAEDGKVYSFPKVLFHETVYHAVPAPSHHAYTLSAGEETRANAAGARRGELAMSEYARHPRHDPSSAHAPCHGDMNVMHADAMGGGMVGQQRAACRGVDSTAGHRMRLRVWRRTVVLICPTAPLLAWGR